MLSSIITAKNRFNSKEIEVAVKTQAQLIFEEFNKSCDEM